MQRIPLSVCCRALFAKDKEGFWFDHFTDEEKELRSMDVWALAKVINDARVRNLAGDAEKLIVAEHMLSVRLAKIQATASWGSGLLGFLGAILGATISVLLTMLLLSADGPQAEPVALKVSVEPITQRSSSSSNEDVDIKTSIQETEK